MTENSVPPVNPDKEPRAPSPVEAMALGFLYGVLHGASPMIDDRDENCGQPTNSLFWPLLGHRFRVTLHEIPAPPREDHPEVRAAADAAVGRKR